MAAMSGHSPLLAWLVTHLLLNQVPLIKCQVGAWAWHQPLRVCLQRHRCTLMSANEGAASHTHTHCSVYLALPSPPSCVNVRQECYDFAQHPWPWRGNTRYYERRNTLLVGWSHFGYLSSSANSRVKASSRCCTDFSSRLLTSASLCRQRKHVHTITHKRSFVSANLGAATLLHVPATACAHHLSAKNTLRSLGSPSPRAYHCTPTHQPPPTQNELATEAAATKGDVTRTHTRHWYLSFQGLNLSACTLATPQ